MLQGLSLPPRITVLLEGESLVNDASGLVLYRFAVAAALTGTFDAGQAALSFGLLSLGGVAAGAALGWRVTVLLLRLRDPTLSVIVSFLAAWAAYIGGEALHVSGVLATVACGLVIGWRQHTVLSAETRTQALAVWGVAVFVLESLVFILIGLSLRGVLQRLGGSWEAVQILAPSVSVIVAAVIVTRFVWILPATYVPRALSPALRRRDPYPPVSVPMVMSWAGMRGVVSLAAALALPEAFPGRDFIVATTFAVILVTVLVQGATLAPLIRILRLGSFSLASDTTLAEAEAGARVAAAQFAEVERHSITRRQHPSPPASRRAVRLPRESGGAVQRSGGRTHRCQAGAFHGRAGGHYRRAARTHSPPPRRLDPRQRAPRAGARTRPRGAERPAPSRRVTGARAGSILGRFPQLSRRLKA